MIKLVFLKNLIIISILIMMVSCNSGKKNSSHGVKPENTEVRETIKKDEVQKVAKKEQEHNYDENRIADSTIIDGIRGLSYIKNNWQTDTVFSFGEEYSIKTIRSIPDSAIIVLVRNSVDKQFKFYELNTAGEIKHDTILTGKYWDLTDINNFIVKPDVGEVYYKTDFQGKLYCYDQKTKRHEEVFESDTLGLDFQVLHRGYQNNTFTSKNGRYSVNIDLFDLSLTDNRYGIIYDFLTTDLEIPGAYWCFGLGSWNEKGTRFYFDNSGEMACIWEIDLENQTLDKIVPEHEAGMPTCIGDDVYYVENNLVKKAIFISKGEIIKKSSGLEEAVINAPDIPEEQYMDAYGD